MIRFWADQTSSGRARWNGKAVFYFCFLMICLYNGLSFTYILISDVFGNRRVFQRILTHSPQDYTVRRALRSPLLADFERTLRVLDRKLPLGDSLSLYAPHETAIWREYFEGTTRLFLYPRNYGENSLDKDHILIPLDKDSVVLPGYKVCRYFSESTLLSKPGKCVWSLIE